MRTLRPLGTTGAAIAPIVLGTMNFGDPTPRDESIAMIDRAIDGGITCIDTADVYVNGESERILGDALAANGRRDAVLVATKVGIPRGEGPPEQWHRREHIVASCERSLRSLRTDRIDLYQLHRPSSLVPQEETLAALDELVQAGKVRWVGASSFPAWMVMEALGIAASTGDPGFVSEQPPYNLLDRRIENELVPLCTRYGLALLPWSPLGGGILAGRYDSTVDVPADSRAARRPQTRGRITDAALAVATGLAELARERGLTTSQLALLWTKDQPGITAPIVGPRTMAQLDDALGVLERDLDDDARVACDALVHPGNAVADFFNTVAWMKTRI
jgi:aryl-alcohol dehydrogenase-like predicted oxidoreductase